LREKLKNSRLFYLHGLNQADICGIIGKIEEKRNSIERGQRKQVCLTAVLPLLYSPSSLEFFTLFFKILKIGA